MLKVGFNSETGEARSGKSLIATGPRRARCTETTTTQTLGKCVYVCVCVQATREEHKVKAWVGALAEAMLLHKASCKTQLKHINWEHSGQTIYGWTNSPAATS